MNIVKSQGQQTYQHTERPMASYPSSPGSSGGYINEFILALADEIAAVRKSGGQKTFLSDGRYLGVRDGRFIYSFTADSEQRFPDDTPVDIEYQRKKYPGVVLSIEGLDLIIGLSADLGKSVATAILHSEPWFLLQKLQERLEAIRTDLKFNQQLAHRLLTPGTAAVPADLPHATLRLSGARAFRGDKFACSTDQQRAVGHVLANPVSFIWGPPGTGKTSTLGMAIAALVEASESVLVVAHSNVAVDVAMASVAQNLGYAESYRTGEILRFGPAVTANLSDYPNIQVRGVVEQQNPQLIATLKELERERKRMVEKSREAGLSDSERQQVKDRIARIKEQMAPLRDQLKVRESELVKKARVVGCTLSKASIAPEVFERQFDAVVIDEASMAYIPHCFFVAALARRRVAIFGDFRQLAPIAQGETERVKRWLQRDVFDEAGITAQVNSNRDDARMVMLTTQHRMHSAIAGVVNRLFYNGRLRNGDGVDERAASTVAAEPAPGHPLALLDLLHVKAHCFTEPESHSRFNLISALFAAQATRAGLASGAESVGIVTPYNAQSRLIRRLLKDLALPDKQVRVATVHRFQGSENRLIVFDAVDGEPQTKAGRLLTGGMGSTAMRLANVALSRAQGKFVGLFNRAYLTSHLSPGDILPAFVRELGQRSNITAGTWKQLTAGEQALPGVTVLQAAPTRAKAIEDDIAAAVEEVAIYWPTSQPATSFSPRALLRCDPTKVRFFVSGPGCAAFQIGLKNAVISAGRGKMEVGVIGLDRRRLWVFLGPGDPSGVVLRLDHPQTTALLYSFWGLVPSRESGTPTSPMPPCPQCGQPYSLDYGPYGVYLRCVNGHSRSVNPKLATELARLSGIHCKYCHGQAVGRQGPGGVFLGCSSYPKCNWMMPLENML